MGLKAVASELTPPSSIWCPGIDLSEIVVEDPSLSVGVSCIALFWKPLIGWSFLLRNRRGLVCLKADVCFTKATLSPFKSPDLIVRSVDWEDERYC